MKANIIRWLLVALALGVVVLCTGLAFGWDCQQKYTNETDETATDLLKTLDREVTIEDAIHDKFNQHTWWKADGKTYIRWYDGTVEPDDWTWACFDFNEEETEVGVEGIQWSKDKAEYADAGSPLGGGASIVEGSSAGYADVTLLVRNDWTSLFGGTATIYATNVYWAIVVHRFSLSDLNDSLFTLPSITWNPLSNFQLLYGQSMSIPLGDLPVNKYLLLRFHAEQAGGILPTTELWQIPIPPQVPAFTQWGLIILVALIVFSTWVVLRRRNAVPSRQ